jgi:hypothetical protein
VDDDVRPQQGRRVVLVQVEWLELTEHRDTRWGDGLCLYAYLHPTRDWLLYVGKCDYSTIRRRLYGAHKTRLFDDIFRDYGVETVRVIQGHLLVGEGRRRSSELLTDVESLLIMRWHPYGNVQCTRHRMSRPGLRVHCTGQWPFKRSRFHDDV